MTRRHIPNKKGRQPYRHENPLTQSALCIFLQTSLLSHSHAEIFSHAPCPLCCCLNVTTFTLICKTNRETRNCSSTCGKLLRFYIRRRGSVVDTVTGLRAGRPRVRVSTPGPRKRFVSSPTCSDRLRGPSSLLCINLLAPELFFF